MNEAEMRARLEDLEHDVALLRSKYRAQVAINAGLQDMLERVLLHFAEKDAAQIASDILRKANKP